MQDVTFHFEYGNLYDGIWNHKNVKDRDSDEFIGGTKTPLRATVIIDIEYE